MAHSQLARTSWLIRPRLTLRLDGDPILHHHAKMNQPSGGANVDPSLHRHICHQAYADKAHDNRRSFNLLDNLNIEPAIQIRKNASTKVKGCPLRRDEVLLIRELGYERWKQLKDAGRRWIVEIIFSSLKRVLGEDLLSKKFKAQKVEAGLKVMLYNKFIGL